MKTTRHFKAAAVLLLGVACAAIAVAAVKHSATIIDTPPAVTVSSTTLASGEQVPVVTVTAKRLSGTEKGLLTLREGTIARKNGGRA